MSVNEREHRSCRCCLLSKNDIRDEIRRQNRSRDRGASSSDHNAHCMNSCFTDEWNVKFIRNNAEVGRKTFRISHSIILILLLALRSLLALHDVKVDFMIH